MAEETLGKPDVMGAICEECGIAHRLNPQNAAFAKHELLQILSTIRTLKTLVGGNDGPQ